MEEHGILGDDSECKSETFKVNCEEDEDEFRSCYDDEDEPRQSENRTKHDSDFYCNQCSATMYFKGVSVSGPEDSYNSRVSGIGVIIENSNSESPIRIQKKLDFYVESSVAECLALLDGLSLAIQNDLKTISAFTDSEDLCNQITRDESFDNHPLMSALRQRIRERVCNFDSFVLKHVPAVELRNALQLAQVAIGIVSFRNEGDESKGSCSICNEEKLSSMILRLGCSHMFCSQCIKTHAEGKLKCEEIPIKCPRSRCEYRISADECRSFLPFTSYESLERVLTTEANARNSVFVEDNYYSEDSLMTYEPTQQFEQWAWDSFVSLPTMTMDAYSDRERSQLALIQRFLSGGFGLSDDQPNYYDRHEESPTDSYVDAMKDLHRLPWLERFVSVINDNYYEDATFHETTS